MKNWRSKGFSEPPRLEVATGEELLYRAESGAAGPGAAEGLFRPLRVAGLPDPEREAHRSRWAGLCWHAQTVRVRAGVPMWIGPVAEPGDSGDAGRLGVLIQEPLGNVDVVTDVRAIREDLLEGR